MQMLQSISAKQDAGEVAASTRMRDLEAAVESQKETLAKQLEVKKGLTTAACLSESMQLLSEAASALSGVKVLPAAGIMGLQVADSMVGLTFPQQVRGREAFRLQQSILLYDRGDDLYVMFRARAFHRWSRGFEVIWSGTLIYGGVVRIRCSWPCWQRPRTRRSPPRRRLSFVSSP